MSKITIPDATIASLQALPVNSLPNVLSSDSKAMLQLLAAHTALTGFGSLDASLRVLPADSETKIKMYDGTVFTIGSIMEPIMNRLDAEVSHGTVIRVRAAESDLHSKVTINKKDFSDSDSRSYLDDPSFSSNVASLFGISIQSLPWHEKVMIVHKYLGFITDYEIRSTGDLASSAEYAIALVPGWRLSRSKSWSNGLSFESGADINVPSTMWFTGLCGSAGLPILASDVISNCMMEGSGNTGSVHTELRLLSRAKPSAWAFSYGDFSPVVSFGASSLLAFRCLTDTTITLLTQDPSGVLAFGRESVKLDPVDQFAVSAALYTASLASAKPKHNACHNLILANGRATHNAVIKASSLFSDFWNVGSKLQISADALAKSLATLKPGVSDPIIARNICKNVIKKVVLSAAFK